jgi:hypothetical protein
VAYMLKEKILGTSKRKKNSYRQQYPHLLFLEAIERDIYEEHLRKSEKHLSNVDNDDFDRNPMLGCRF